MQFYIMSRREKRKCSNCQKEVIPIKGVSILNIGFYLLIGLIVFTITNNKSSFLIPIILSIVNSLFVKPICPICKESKFLDTL